MGTLLLTPVAGGPAPRAGWLRAMFGFLRRALVRPPLPAATPDAAPERADTAPSCAPACFAPARPNAERSVRVATPSAMLDGVLGVPARSRGLVVMVDTSGSASYAPASAMIAHRLLDAGFATLCVCILPGAERFNDPEAGALRFDVALAADRVRGVIAWASQHPTLSRLPIAVFAAGAGAAAALSACTDPSLDVRAIVCRGGRPELAGAELRQVRAPTLFLVGASDAALLAMSRSAAQTIGRGSRVQPIAGARSLITDEHALDAVVQQACAWLEGAFEMEHLAEG